MHAPAAVDHLGEHVPEPSPGPPGHLPGDGEVVQTLRTRLPAGRCFAAVTALVAGPLAIPAVDLPGAQAASYRPTPPHETRRPSRFPVRALGAGARRVERRPGGLLAELGHHEPLRVHPGQPAPDRGQRRLAPGPPQAQLLALHLGRRKDAGTLRPEQVSLGKLNNVREALEICRTARTILGANGISLEYPVIRHMNNLESVLTYEGTVEMHTLVVGQALTGESAFR